LKLRDQLYIYLIPSITLGLLFNTIRDKGISHLAQPSIELSIGDNLTVSTSVPTIRNINLDLAIKFHNEGFLFVDARAEEYLNEGFIPNAISHDNIDTLAEKIDSLIGYDTGFVIYCSDDDCGSSEELAYELQDLGFINILVFKGGWKSWTDAGLEYEVYD